MHKKNYKLGKHIKEKYIKGKSENKQWPFNNHSLLSNSLECKNYFLWVVRHS